MNKIYIYDKKSMELYLEELLFPCFINRRYYKKEVANYCDKTADFEQFSRFLLGITAYLFNHKDQELYNNILLELKSYIDPLSESYIDVKKWSDSQIYVEMFAPLFFLYTFRNEAKEFIQENVASIIEWCSPIFDLNIPDQDNWIWFQIMANCLLYKIGIRKFDYEYNSRLQKKIDSMYKKQGYYLDGIYGEFDNYNAYAFFFYSLIYSSLMEMEDTYNSQKHFKRAEQFFYTYVNFFSDGGRNIPYGRSITYKYGFLAFISALVYTGREIIDYGYLKDILFKSLNEWVNQSIYRDGNYVVNGYYYENDNLLEEYNSYGSPYWAFKVFVILVAENESFWNAERKNFSILKKNINLPNALIKNYDGEQYIFPSINPLGYRCTMHSDKYEKFVHSTLFGFNVSKCFDRNTVSADNTLTISYDKKTFVNRSYVESEIITDNIIRSQYCFSFTNIIQYDFIQMPFILHLYLIDSKENCYIREGAFPVEINEIEKIFKSDWCIIKNNYQCSGIKSIGDAGRVTAEPQIPNTNVFFRRSIVPICDYEIKKGKSTHSTIEFGCKNDPENYIIPQLVYKQNKVYVSFGDIEHTIKLNETYRGPNVILCKKIQLERRIRNYKNKLKYIISKI